TLRPRKRISRARACPPSRRDSAPAILLTPDRVSGAPVERREVAVVLSVLLIPVEAEGVEVALLRAGEGQALVHRVADPSEVHLIASQPERPLDLVLGQIAGGERPVLAAAIDRDRRRLDAQELADERREAGKRAAGLPAQDGRERVALLVAGAIV